MKNTFYKPIKRRYYENWQTTDFKIGTFIASGQWADGHLAYSRLDENGNTIEDEDCVYVQLFRNGHYFMQRI